MHSQVESRQATTLIDEREMVSMTTHSFILSLIRSFVCLFIHSFVCAYIRTVSFSVTSRSRIRSSRLAALPCSPARHPYVVLEVLVDRVDTYSVIKPADNHDPSVCIASSIDIQQAVGDDGGDDCDDIDR